MTDRPIIFSGPMILALLTGRKTMTRRLAWRETRLEIPSTGERQRRPTYWQNAKPGDRLWVRETWAQTRVAPIVETIDNPMVVYRAGDNRTDYGGPWRSPIHMPRRASRLTLAVTAVKVERLQDITEVDAKAEGIPPYVPDSVIQQGPCWYRFGFRDLWNSLHGPGAWDANPWVVAVSFTKESDHAR